MRKQLNFITARTVDTVLDAALNRPVEAPPAVLATPIAEDAAKLRRPGLQQ